MNCLSFNVKSSRFSKRSTIGQFAVSLVPVPLRSIIIKWMHSIVWDLPVQAPPVRNIYDGIAGLFSFVWPSVSQDILTIRYPSIIWIIRLKTLTFFEWSSFLILKSPLTVLIMNILLNIKCAYILEISIELDHSIYKNCARNNENHFHFFPIKLVFNSSCARVVHCPHIYLIVGNPKSQKIFLLAFLSTFWHPC